MHHNFSYPNYPNLCDSTLWNLKFLRRMPVFRGILPGDDDLVTLFFYTANRQSRYEIPL